MLSIDEVRTSIDALVADEPIDVNIRQPPGGFEFFGRSGTPSVPPGLGIPSSAFPSPSISHASLPATFANRVASPVAVPKTPVRAHAVISATPLSGKKPSTPSVPDAKKHIKALAAESGLSKEISKAKSQTILQDKDFPALNSPKPPPAATPVATPKPLSKTAAKKAEKAAAKSKQKAKEKEEKEKGKAKEEQEKGKFVAASAPIQAQASTSNLVSALTSAKSEPIAVKATPKTGDKVVDAPAAVEKKVERPVPGTLNIAAATKASQIRNIDTASAGDKSATDKDSAFPALPNPTPVSMHSPITRTAPKTLRVVPTPKTENPPTPVCGAATVLTAPSVRSLASAETPGSEIISDTASIISASISASRASSPPPSRVGAAPVRTATKSQQRKQRKEVLKKESAVIAAQPVKAEPEVEIGPIVGRKKKQKKEKPAAAASKMATPAVSRPSTPLAASASSSKDGKDIKETKEIAEPVKEAVQESSTYRSTANETTSLTDEPVHGRYPDSSKGKMTEDSKPSDPSTPRVLPTPAAILQNLQKRGQAPQSVEKLPLFKPTNVVAEGWFPNNIRPRELAPNLKSTMIPTKNIVTEEDQTILLTGKPVRKIVDGVPILITPNGDCLRHLTEEEQDRFLELQGSLAQEANSPAAFVCSRHDNGIGGFSLVKGRAVPNGPPSYLLNAPGAYPSDPVNKIQREEAIYYINQYVLPRLNLSSRDISFPKAMSDWSVARNIPGSWLNNTASGGGGGGPTAARDEQHVAEPELIYSGPITPNLENVYRAPSAGGGGGGVGALASYLEGLPAAAAAAAAAAGDGSNHPGAGEKTGGSVNPGGHHVGGVGSVPLMSLEEAEQTLAVAKKEAEKLDKALVALVKKNKRLLTASLGN